MRVPAFPESNRSIREYDIAAGQTYIEGAVLTFTAGEVVEGGADPTSIVGIGLHKAGALPNETKQLVALAEPGARFWFQGDSDPVAADVGTAIGITKDGDGIWHVDGTKVGASARVRVIRIDTDRELYLVEFENADTIFA